VQILQNAPSTGDFLSFLEKTSGINFAGLIVLG